MHGLTYMYVYELLMIKRKTCSKILEPKMKQRKWTETKQTLPIFDVHLYTVQFPFEIQSTSSVFGSYKYKHSYTVNSKRMFTKSFTDHVSISDQ